MTQVQQTQSGNSSLKKEDCKTLGLSSLGGALEFYDFVIFIFYTSIISKLFFPPGEPGLATLATLGLFAAGYLVRPIGGVIMAHFGDKFGRKKMFGLSIFLMAFPTLVIGLLPGYDTIGYFAPILLLLMRIMQGVAIGGEIPGAWVFIAEHTPKQHYGLGLGILTGGIVSGVFLGTIVSIILGQVFSSQQIQDFAWRIPFILGGIFGFVSVYLRRFLEETPIFKQMAAKKELSKELPLWTVIKSHKAATLLIAALTLASSSAMVVGILMTPDVVLISIYKVDREVALYAGLLATLGLTVGCCFWGWLTDKIGTRITMVLCWGGLAISALYFYGTLSHGMDHALLMLNYTILAFFVGSMATTPIVSARVFPPKIRYTGLSFSYNVAYAIFGGLTPIIVGWWLNYSSEAPGYYIALSSVVGIIAGFFPLAYKGWTAQRGNNSNGSTDDLSKEYV